jgi:Uma2 family endonuclease
VQKHAKYEQAGVASYWVIDPDRPSVPAWDLVDGRYQLVGAAEGEQGLQLRRPFPVTPAPSALFGPHYA